MLAAMLLFCACGRSAQASSEHALRGPLAMTPDFLKLDTEVLRGVAVLKAGSMFPVTMLTRLDTRSATPGQPIEAMLVDDIVIGGKNVAPKGSKLSGWVSAVHNPRNVLKSKFSSTNWLNSNGALLLHFSTITPASGGPRLNIDAQPAPNTPVRGPHDEHELCVHKDGCISVKWSGVKYGAAGLAIGAASWATGPLRLIAGPVMSGTAGAIQPAYALDHPVEDANAATRTKGCLVGAVKGLPGGFFVTGLTNHGGEISVPSGVQLEIQLSSDLIIAQPAARKAAR